MKQHFTVSVLLSALTPVVGLHIIPAPLLAQGCLLTERQRLTSADPDGLYSFGRSIAFDGESIVVGSTGWENRTYVFRLGCRERRTASDDCLWIEASTLAPTGYLWYYSFGSVVAVEKDSILVTAPWTTYPVWADPSWYVGSMHFFQRDDTLPQDADNYPWREVREETGFWYSVAIKSDVAVCSGKGGVAVYYREELPNPPGNTWQMGTILTPPQSGSTFGAAVALTGQRIVVGARTYETFVCTDTRKPCDTDSDCSLGWCEGSGERCRTHDDCLPPNQSAASMTRETDKNLQESYLSPDDPAMALRPACLGGASCGIQSGAAHVYRREDESWIEETTLVAEDFDVMDYFGDAVAIDGDRIIVGAPRFDGDEVDSGAAYVFLHNDNGTPSIFSDDFWVQEAKLAPSVAQAYGYFGASVDLSHSRAIVGAHAGLDAADHTGSAYVYELDRFGTPSDLSDDTWTNEVELTVSDASQLNDFGISVAIDGVTAVVGSTGAAYVYTVGGCQSLREYAELENCFSGDATITSECEFFDYDGDGLINLDDFSRFGEFLSGPIN